MSRVILTVSEQPILLEWARKRCGAERPWTADAEAMGAVESETGKIRAVMVVNGFMGDTAMVHFATDQAKTWGLKREIIAGFLGYLFIFKKLNRVFGFTPADNAPMLKLLTQLGFQFEARVRRSQDGREQDIMTSMFAAECRWIQQGDHHG